MKENKNPIWSFFASVKLALFTLIILAVTSIIGTLIPQNEPMNVYVQKFGPATAKIFQILNIPDMYNSWWFISILAIFSLNLIVCSLERIPRVWSVVTQDNLLTETGRLEKMKKRSSLQTNLTLNDAGEAVRKALPKMGWRQEEAEKDGGILFFMQKGAWSRFGVYTVHSSILIIFIGAIIGSLWGYKASIMLPEGATADRIFLSNEEHTQIPIDFQVRCDKFTLSYYENGMPREFRSNLTVLENNKIMLEKSIIVNDPLDYGGLTFYQSSYQPMQGQFFVEVGKQDVGDNQKFIVQLRKEQKWPEEGITFGLVNISGPDWKKEYRYKVWFSDGKSEAKTFWVDEASPIVVKATDTNYLFYVKQRFATGLQIAKDPGVWWVYIGCTVMLIGLYIAFFLSHRRLWVFVSQKEGDEQTRVLVSGLSNKNRLGFDKDFEKITNILKKDDKLNISKDQS